ncbi:MAG TPA: OmpA family protein [Gemmatimonadales bacterium]|jgi:outer membrane protein OmpA-like peptidoglycan-associated protein|nr:OmpA family protein [Gemmatimonadales bacterium]
MRPILALLALAAAGALATALTAAPAEAQFGKRLTQALKDNAENRAIQKVVEHENQAIDAALTSQPTSADDAAGASLYQTLTASGRTTADAIEFQEGTATMKPTSAATLKAIGSMLKAHGDLKLRLESYAEDKAVATARSEAVRDALVKAYAVDVSRLEAEGYGAKSNPRVELVQR